MLSRLICAVAIACLSFTLGNAQDCENGQCERRQPVRNVVKGVAQRSVQAVRTVREVQPVRSLFRVSDHGFQVGSSVSGGCTGSVAVSYGSCGSSMSYGSSGSRDTDGALIVSVGESRPLVAPTAPSASGEVDALGIRKRRESRAVIVDAATQAHAAGTIDASQLQAIKLATRSPRMLSRMEDLILERAQASGAYTFALDANGEPIKALVEWDKIADFILKLAPLIFKLIEMFTFVSPSFDGSIASFLEADLSLSAC